MFVVHCKHRRCASEVCNYIILQYPLIQPPHRVESNQTNTFQYNTWYSCAARRHERFTTFGVRQRSAVYLNNQHLKWRFVLHLLLHIAFRLLWCASILDNERSGLACCSCDGFHADGGQAHQPQGQPGFVHGGDQPVPGKRASAFLLPETDKLCMLGATMSDGRVGRALA